MTFILYSKSGCENCLKAKALLSNEEHVIINCDTLLKNNRDEFVKSIELKTRMPFKCFPVIFHRDTFLGGYDELVDYLNFELVEEF